jgi:non-specific serine/threonine protein kinase/serine/threonine-protein kinase
VTVLSRTNHFHLKKQETLDGPSHSPEGETFVESSAQASAPPETRSIGPYRLIRKLGQGGRGQVWLAEQTVPLHRQVALKVIRAGVFNEILLQRFLAERQSLAIMSHPCIAKVFDAGTTPNGQPFFVMEYVPGQPVTNYCDRKKLNIRERLALFIKICEGVQHAHQKAVIHRDLKPSNILVQDVDGLPTPRIIDFGVSKNAAPQSDDEKSFTQFGVFVGTPGYISPEQADPTLGDVDTRADVYSLGVIFYVLLTGTLPFDPDQWQKKPIHEVLRQLREEDPATPSTKVGTDRTTQTATAETRSTEPQELVSLLRGDLDWIALKALAKDRANRYDSPSAFAADIQRYLNNEPVLATPPSLVYRAGKFVRRHRVGVVAASAVAIMLVVLAASMTVQAVRISRERDRANREATAAKSVSDFLTGLFRVSDPSRARGNSITAREILDKGGAQIETSLAAQPEVQARLMATMGEVYWSLGLYDSAQPLLEKSLETRRRVRGPENPATLQSMDLLAKNFERRANYSKAEELAQEVLAIRRRVQGPDNKETLASIGNLAGILYDEGRFGEAEKQLREMLAIQRRVLEPDHPDIPKALVNLGLVLGIEGHSAEAEPLFREALATQRRISGPDHPITLAIMTNLGRALSDEGKYSEADQFLRQALEAQRRVIGPDHSDTLWSAHVLASNLRNEGGFLEAEKLDRQNLEIRRRTLGPEHASTLASMTTLAIDLDMQHRYAEGSNLYSEVLELQRRVLGPDHPDTANTKYNLACNAALTGHRDAAIEILNDALDHGLAPADIANMSQDEDFQSLRGDPRFQAVITRARERLAALKPH